MNSGKGSKGSKDTIICLCNNVSRSTIEEAIRTGADTLNKIFDRTTAGVGPCGGSCRRKIGPMLDHYLATGTFPDLIKEDRRGKQRR
jgi:bacterioferritin-associated ferredoxin